MAQTARFLSIDDLSNMPHPKWMIEGLFEANSLVMLAGPPASYKSFLALDWMLCMATGRKWMNKQTSQANVLYVLGEGKSSLLKRIQSWCHFHQISPEQTDLLRSQFRVAFDVPQMASKSSVDNLLAGLSAENFTPNVIVIDTFARSFVGLDENSQKDTGLWVESADRLRQLGYTVIFLHHTAKNTEFGLKYRGSTAIMGAMDTAMTMDRDNSHVRVAVKVTKQKDHDEGAPMYFNRLNVTPFPGEEGSIVLVPAPQIDERFTEEGIAIEEAITKLVLDPAFDSDRAKARELSRLFPQLSESAAHSRLRRQKKMVEVEAVETVQ